MKLPVDFDQIENAASHLLSGGLVAFPTETVYGLGADAENPEAIAAIYAAKGRPANHPVIVHLAPDARLDYWACDIPDIAWALTEAFWPGPLTLILRRAPHVPDAVSGGQDTIGLRCPSHPVAQALLAQFAALKGGDGGVAAPSANKFGQVSPTTAQHVHDGFPEFDASQLMVLDGGPSAVGIESTILDLSRVGDGQAPVLLRPGHISPKDIADVIGIMPSQEAGADAPRVSGSLKAHYAPHTPLNVISSSALALLLSQPADGLRRAILGFGDVPVTEMSVQWFKASGKAATYAHDLYARLHEMDALGVDLILLEEPPQTPAWQAVNDRIGRAAAAFKRPDSASTDQVD